MGDFCTMDFGKDRISTMEKVYVVEASSGEYDDYMKWVHAVYLTEEEANKSRDELKEKMRLLKEIPCPVDDTILEDLSEEDFELYDKWALGSNEASEFNTAIVKEYKIGKIYEH